MNSEQTSELLQALAAAIADMPDPKKNAKNPHFNNRFADLGQVLECVREPLANHGLLMTQTCDGPVLITRVWHPKSGQWIESRMTLVLDKQTAQAQGSAITYARRYALKALFGMVDVDDDGSAASERRETAPARPAPKKPESRGPAPYETLDEAKGSIEGCKTLEGLEAIAARIAASKFEGGDKAELRESYKNRKAELEESKAVEETR